MQDKFYRYDQCYINGQWQDLPQGRSFEVTHPADETTIGQITLGNREDVDRAVAAAKAAFVDFSQTSKDERIELLTRVIALYKERYSEMARHISDEMGAPMDLAEGAQAGSGLAHLKQALVALKASDFCGHLGQSRVYYEPVGVCAMITPWNWPINQIACKVAPALAAGCTMVLKPSEIAPLSAYLFAQILDDAGVPPGVFNLVNGDGAQVGAALSSHPDVDMVSFTGSTRAGSAVAKAAADSVKRVSQELGGKSANILLDDVDWNEAVKHAVETCMHNTGQSCNAPTRLLVPQSQYAHVVTLARKFAEQIKVGRCNEVGVFMGPVVSEAHYHNVQAKIAMAIDEGAELICGGLGKPEALEQGYFVKPTIFAKVDNSMQIAQQEVFGPVLVIITYQDEDDAINIANDSPYGLSGYIYGKDEQRALRVAKKLRTGMVHINGAWTDPAAPFGGYKQSGNGREWGKFGLSEYLEIKAVMGLSE